MDTALMIDPFSIAWCCAPRAKLKVPEVITVKAQGHLASLMPGEKATGIKSFKSAGSETDSAHSDTNSERSYTSSASRPAGMVQLDRRLEHLSALLVSKEISKDAKQELLEYAIQPAGRLACVVLLTAELTGDGRPPRRSVAPDAFAVLQEMLGQLTLDAMRRDASDELRAIVAVSHRLDRVGLDQCEECDLECQECDPEPEDPTGAPPSPPPSDSDLHVLLRMLRGERKDEGRPHVGFVKVD